MRSLKTSARCHSIAHTRIGIEIDLEKPKLEEVVATMGAPDCPVCTKQPTQAACFLLELVHRIICLRDTFYLQMQPMNFVHVPIG
jgi:uncharacterized protein (UPF0212 family)